LSTFPYEISTDKSRLDLELIHDFLCFRSYWALGIPKEIVRKAVENSLCFGVYHPQAGQVGFARVITDHATFAYLSDVFILENHRKAGLSKHLVEHILRYPELQELRRFLLITKDAHRLYAQFGFKPINHPENFMQINDPNAYQTDSKGYGA
jgi:N-acetylglutamate synthase-like GNAT family acetyltransferase